MGTNFYKRGHCREDDPDNHLGKRSAAGLYCWDCGVTLCKAGESRIHHSGFDREATWYTKCPQCGAEPMGADISTSAVGRELGFNKAAPAAKRGVDGCASFTWAMPQEVYLALGPEVCPTCGSQYDDPEKIIEDEYGTLYTREEFEAVLTECPVIYVEHTGTEFS